MKITKVRGFLPFLLVVFFNAFVDLGHKVLIQDTLFQTTDGPTFTLLSAIINAFILLPYVLLFTPSGFIADKWAKTRVLQFTAALAIPMTLLITWCYYQGYFWGAFGLTLLLATQSALNSPAKYGAIKELFGKQHLARANAWVQTLTIIAILSATFVFTLFFSHFIANVNPQLADQPSSLLKGFAPLGFILVAASVVETLMTFLLPQQPAANPAALYKVKDYFNGHNAKHYLRVASSNKVIILCILGLSLFWAINQVLLASYGAFAKEVLNNASVLFVQAAMALAGIGVLIGATYAGKLSSGYIETGIIPLGALGISFGLLLLPHLTGQIAIMGLFLIYGVFGGLLIVPLNALIQFNAGKKSLGKILAANNFIQNLFMIGFLLLTVLVSYLGFSSRYLLTALFVCALVGTAYALYALPQSLMRYVIYVIASSIYRIRVEGLDNLPSEGGVLLLGNHVSFIDWAFLQIASPRPIRFVMEKRVYDKWYLNWLFKQFKLIPIAKGASQAALSQINDALNKGEVVCLFPEGRLSINGQLGPFKTGFERAAKEANALIIPFYLLGLWGSKTSYAPSAIKKSARYQGHHVSVHFAPAMPIESPARQVRQRVKELSITAWQAHLKPYGSLPEAWLSMAKKNRRRTALIDTVGRPLSHARVIATTWHYMKSLYKPLDKVTTVGVLLPTSGSAVMINLACWCLGLRVVNLDPALELQAQLKKAKIKHLISSKRYLDTSLPGVTSHLIEHLKPPKAKLSIWRYQLWVTLLPLKCLKALLIKPLQLDDTAVIAYHKQQRIELSHGQLLAQVKQLVGVLSLKDDDVMLNALPMSSPYGLVTNVIMPLIQGIPMVCAASVESDTQFGKFCVKHDISMLFLTPHEFHALAQSPHLTKSHLQSLRLLFNGTSPLDEPTRELFSKRYFCEVYETYGEPTISPLISCNLPDSISQVDYHLHRANKPHTVGFPLPGKAFRIINPNTLDNLTRGEQGLVMIGCAEVKKDNQEHIDWVVTDKTGYLDDEGFLNLTKT